MLQLIYVSTARANDADCAAILATSRENNGRDGITGLLYSDGKRFLQALEGPEDRVEAALARIQADPRHRAIVLLSRRTVDHRDFGDWAMAHRLPGADGDLFLARVAQLVAQASPDVRATFEGFAEARRAA
ncbi:BLUF domain-containing protein [Sphingomonas sp. KR3-1]|uniref:BLUF domain-containing protein n=1 Tax=Sphingomonas sp. KR3-1 TaxID=3156611 RepID=UPI0032B5A8E5